MSNRHNVKRTLLLLFLIGFSLTACSMPNHDNLYDNTRYLIEKVDYFTMENVVSTHKAGYYQCNVESSSGIDTIWLSKAATDESVILECNLEVTTGSAKVILVNGADELITLIEKKSGEKTDGFVEIKLPIRNGSNYIKLVTQKSAKLKLELKSKKAFEIVED